MAKEYKKIQHDRGTGQTVIVLPPIKAPKWLEGFLHFLRAQGVVGLGVGLILGIAGKSVVDSLVYNLLNPIIGLLYGGGDFSTKYICLKSAGGECINKLGYGNFLNAVISFVLIASVVYFLIKGLKLDKLDIKEKAENESGE